MTKISLEEEFFKVALYIRVSSSPQRYGGSLEDQERKLRIKAEEMGYVVYKVYTDVASATTIKNRPGFLDMISAAEKSKFKAIIVNDTSRLFRNYVDAQAYKRYLREELNIPVIFDEQDHLDPFLEQLFDAYDEYFSTRAGIRSSSGKRNRVLSRRLPVGPMPIGYKEKDVHKGKMVFPDLDFVPLIQLAFVKYSTNLYSDRDIAMLLNVEADRKGMKVFFTLALVNRLLQNPIYCGMIRYKGELYKGRHLAFIQYELFVACQNVRRDRMQRPRAYGYKTQTFPLGRVIRCSKCGVSTWCHATGKYRYYQHPKSNECEDSQMLLRNECEDSQMLLRAEICEGQLDDLMKRTSLDFRLQRKVEEISSDIGLHTRLKVEKSRLQKQLERFEILEDVPLGLVNEVSSRLQSLVIPCDDFSAENLVDSTGLGFLWLEASAIEKRNIATIMFRYLRVDFHEKRIVEIGIPECFESLFRKYMGEIDIILAE